MPRVVVYHDLPIADALAGRWDDVSIASPEGPIEAAAALADAEIFVTNTSLWDDRFRDSLAAGEWVQATSAGYDAFPIAAFRDADVNFTNAGGIHDPAVAEHVFALATALTRSIPTFVSKQASGEWGPRRAVSDDLTDLTDRTLTIFGLGSIGEEVARRSLAFGMDVYGVKRHPERYDGHLPSASVLGTDEFSGVLGDTDVLVLTVPLTESTRHSIDATVFRSLPDGAIVVNVARGPVVDEPALIDALRAGEIAGAGLDVFETEPLPADSPLWGRDDVIVTPHIGGRTDNFTGRFVDLFVDNYERWRSGEPLRNRIT